MQRYSGKPEVLYTSASAVEEGTAPYTHVMEVIQGLRKRGFPVRLVAVDYGGRQPSIGRRCVSIVVVQLRILLTLITSKLRRKRLILYERYHVFMPFPSIVAGCLRIPSLLEVNGRPDDFVEIWNPPRLIAGMIVKTVGPSLRAASAVIAVTESLSDSLRKEFKVHQGKLHVVPNGVDVEVFSPGDRRECRLKLGLNETGKIITYVGSLSIPRGVGTLMGACGLLEGAPLDVQTLIVGGGALEDDIRRSIDEKGLANRVLLIGQVPNESVPHYVCAADVCVAPYARCLSNVNGLSPLKVYEYLACGRPVVASDFPWISGVLREGPCGIVVEPDDASALSEGIRWMLEHPEEAEEMGRRGRALVQKRFTWDMTVDRIAQVIGDLCHDA
jgi:glycosyltransferase involved in cell wall biosynthesis